MDVKPFDAPGRYLVSSESEKKDAYLVDLLAWNGEGQCACPQWEHRIGPYLKREEVPEHRFCKHIIKAREAFLDSILQRMIQAGREAE